MAKIKLNGDTSGYIEISAPPVSGNNTLELGPGTKILTNLDNTFTGVSTFSSDVYLGNDIYLTDGSSGHEQVEVDSNDIRVAGKHIHSQFGVWTRSASVNDRRLGIEGAGNNLLLYSNSTEKVRITDSGKVGINTASPRAVLDIEGNAENFTLFLHSNDANANLQFSDNTGGARILNYGGDLAFRTGTNAHSFGAGDSEALRITSSGNMGVGNADPTQAKLVAQTASGSSLAAIKDNTGGSIVIGGVTQPRILMEAGHNASELRIYSAGGSSYGSASWTERLRITSGGNLQLYSGGNLQMASNGRIFVGNGGNATNPMFANVSDTNTGIAFPAADTMMFTTGGSERLSIDSSGNATFKHKVNIGTSHTGGEILSLGKTSGTSYLGFINGGTHVGFVGYADQLIVGGASNEFSVRSQDDLLFAAGGNTERLRIESDGRITHTGKNGAASSTAIDPLASFVLNDGEARLQLCATNGGNNAAGVILSNESKHWIMHHRGPNSANRFDIGYYDSATPSDINQQASTHFRITKEGVVNLPQQPRFFAYASTTLTKSTGFHTFSWDHTRFNVGNDFSTSTNVFTAPVDGCYLFGTQVRFDGGGTGYFRLIISINSSTDDNSQAHSIQDSNGSTGDSYFSQAVTGLYELSANDNVRVLVNSSSDTSWQPHSESQFWGYLVA